MMIIIIVNETCTLQMTHTVMLSDKLLCLLLRDSIIFVNRSLCCNLHYDYDTFFCSATEGYQLSV